MKLALACTAVMFLCSLANVSPPVLTTVDKQNCISVDAVYVLTVDRMMFSQSSTIIS